MATAAPAHGIYSSSQTVPSTSDQLHSPGEEQYFSTFFCRALYDYQTNDKSLLSFRQDDIIEVLTKLDSGWWDGLLGQRRGWFPCNYVSIVSGQQAANVSVAPSQPTSQHSSVETTRTTPASLSKPPQIRALPRKPTPSNDSWVPRSSVDGRTSYLNTQTGQQSLDLPQEDNRYMPDGDLSGLSTRNAVLGLGATTGANDYQNGGQAGFGTFARTGNLEFWKKVLADDGMSYYFLNTIDGSVSWTLPSVDSAPGPSTFAHMKGSHISVTTIASDCDDALVTPVAPSASHRFRSDSTLSRPSDREYSTDSSSVYSDDLDTQPGHRQRSDPLVEESHNGSFSDPAPLKMKSKQPQKMPKLTSVEQSAQLLQEALAPPRRETIYELSKAAQDAIATVVNYIQTHKAIFQPKLVQELNETVLLAVSRVRNLLYVSATPSSSIPSSLYLRQSRGSLPPPASQTLQAHLKSAQRKVAGTLSKLVLSTLAIQYDSGISSSDNPERMEADAVELEHAVAAFVLEIQQFLDHHALSADQASIKRLHAVFSTENIGLGLIGGGAAAEWKGFGWMALDEMEEAPQRLLSAEVLLELKSHVSNLEAKSARFTDAPPDNGNLPDVLAKECQEFIRELHGCLLFVCNIHVARHVDVDGIKVGNGLTSNRDRYLQTVDSARNLVRTLESSVQALYDDGAAFLVFAQTVRSDIHGYPSPTEPFRSLALALKHNLDCLSKTCESLLLVGHEQAELGKADYNGSIEWRMSRISMIGNQYGIAKDFQDDGDLVDPEWALQQLGSDNDRGQIYRETTYRASFQSAETWSESAGGVFAESPVPMNSTPTRFMPNYSTKLSPNRKGAEIPPSLNLEKGGATSDGPATARKVPLRGAKLLKILGDDAPQAYIDKVNADLKKWYLRSDHPASDLITDPEGTVRGGTIQALMEHLTTHDAPDTKYNRTFLMTYKSFTTTNDLFELLVQRFWIQPPDNLEPEELEEWKTLKQHVVRVRVLNTLKNMVTDDDVLESEDTHIFERIKEFVSIEAVVGFAAAKQLMVHIERAKRGDVTKVTPSTPSGTPPASIIPKSKEKLKMSDIDPLEMARQLTLMENRLYTKIRPIECLQRSRDVKSDTADNISSVIQFSNRISKWVEDSILVKEDSRRRAGVLKNFISIADRCRTMHNFPSMVSIVAGLNTPSIRRLKRTWEQIPPRLMALLAACETMMDTKKNFGNYRTILAQITPPCVPFIGVFLTQLTFINENPNTIGSNLINFRKRQQTAEVIQDIKRWQSVPYNFVPVQQVVNFVDESLLVFADGQNLSDHFWNLSLEREPREREEDKMARLLQESGFA